ncbi:MAG: sigma-54 dependent transcriptional regulator [Opitutaceae bacterium]|nr:sigma-54 dependent transcriptional regulator [Opitutaceae bacterium]
MKLLLVGDEERMRKLAAFGLIQEHEESTIVSSAAEVEELDTLSIFNAAVVDWEMRKSPASELIASLRERWRSLPVVALVSSSERGLHAQKAGAIEVMLKPVEVDAARALIMGFPQSQPAKKVFPSTPVAPAAAPVTTVTMDLNPQSQCMRRVLSVIDKVAPTPATVLLLGESGTGKTTIARHLHEKSNRSNGPFVTVNCPCLQAPLLESELFGHVRGAFTGAIADSVGLVAAANGGTLFLDEIGEMPLALQSKLLRLLQERCYERLGETKVRTADIRIIAATNRNLRDDVAAGKFREDLFYRLNVISIEVPSLRQRPEDILSIAKGLLRELGAQSGRRFTDFTTDAALALQRHPWPGNLRELRNCLERAVILSDGPLIHLSDLPELSSKPEQGPQVGEFVTLAELEEAHIQRVLEKAGSLMQAARLLGIDKTTLYRKRRRQFTTTAPFEETLRSAV